MYVIYCHIVDGIIDNSVRMDLTTKHVIELTFKHNVIIDKHEKTQMKKFHNNKILLITVTHYN